MLKPLLAAVVGVGHFAGLVAAAVAGERHDAVVAAELVMCPLELIVIGLDAGPNTTFWSLNASITGIPACVFAENILPLISSTILNNVPCCPCTLNTVEPLFENVPPTTILPNEPDEFSEPLITASPISMVSATNVAVSAVDSARVNIFTLPALNCIWSVVKLIFVSVSP